MRCRDKAAGWLGWTRMAPRVGLCLTLRRAAQVEKQQQPMRPQHWHRRMSCFTDIPTLDPGLTTVTCRNEHYAGLMVTNTPKYWQYAHPRSSILRVRHSSRNAPLVTL